ncbi:alpha/beta hydrolase [Pseudonocardia acaciae]|uniref:alpha/beta hydrolase n=1 Tax=Pseudonocardia acaciae TaxID=551276 RepID=UPI00048B4246|nr:alpha/beta hydrolase [Pseudonocardia acaciae]
MSSKESAALREVYRAVAERAAANPPGMDYETAMSRLAAEPADVRYSEVTAAGLPAIWADPEGCDPERVLVFFHGGGFVSGSKDSHRKLAAHLAKAAGCRALVPDYRLAPEHTFPAQLDDARAVYDWLLDRGHRPSRIALAGDSAGGNIATACALALERDGRPLPAAVAAFSPWYDMEAAGETFESNAANDFFISRELVHIVAPLFLGGHSPSDPLANPLYADPSGLPAVFVTCGGDETLRSSVEGFAESARRAGVEVALDVCDGMQHAYQCMVGRAPEADAAIIEAGKWLREKLDS